MACGRDTYTDESRRARRFVYRGSTGLELTFIPPAEWQTLVPEWQQLLEATPEHTVFLAPSWITNWWRCFGEGKEPCLVAARDSACRLVALAPLYYQPIPGLPLKGSLRLMGDQDVGSEYLGFLIAPGFEQEFLCNLFQYLQGTWTMAELHGLREDFTLSRRVAEVLSGSGGPVSRRRKACSSISLPSDYEAYLASLEQKFRTTVRHRTNKLTKNFRVRLVQTARPEEIGPHLERFFAMHQSRWQAQGHQGSFHSSQKRSFYYQVADDFLRRGWLRFYHLEVDGTIRAAQFGFTFDRVFYSLQEAFDHQFRPPGVGGVGVVLRGMAIRECISEGSTEYDFLAGTEEFKTRWGTHAHYVQQLRVGAPGLRGTIAFARIVGPTKLREFARQRAPSWLVRAIAYFRDWRRKRSGTAEEPL